MTARVRMKRHPNGVCVAHVTVPTKLGTITVGGFGDFLAEALNTASSVAQRVASDPVVSAILPPQAKVAIAAVKEIAAAAQHSPEALKSTLTQFDGPGKRRVVAALHAEAKALDAGASPAVAAKVATKAADNVKPSASSVSSGTSGLPSFLASQGVGDYMTDMMRQHAANLATTTNAQSARDRGVSSDNRMRAPGQSRRTPKRKRAPMRGNVSRTHSLAQDRARFGDTRQPMPDEYEGQGIPGAPHPDIMPPGFRPPAPRAAPDDNAYDDAPYDDAPYADAYAAHQAEHDADEAAYEQAYAEYIDEQNGSADEEA